MTLDRVWLTAVLNWRARVGRARRLVRAARLPRRPVTRMPLVGGFRVAAVQLRFELCDERRFVAKVNAKLAEAVGMGAELVLFPEETGTMLFGMVPGMARLLGEGGIDEALRRLGPDVRVPDVVRLVGPAVRRVYEAVFEEFARRYRLHVGAGTILVPTADERVLNVAYLFGPHGRIGAQPKCHLLPLEFGWGLDAGDDLDVWSTPLGRLAMPVCNDATYFETFRILSLKGAEVVLVPTANPEAPYNPFKAMRGVWPRVQESATYGVVSAMVGEAFGLPLSGRSAVYAPLPLSPSGDGILAEAATAEEEEVVVADLDLGALERYRAEFGPPFRPEVYQRYFPTIYHGHWRGVTSRGDV
jgi:predicted amidohydrolase